MKGFAPFHQDIVITDEMRKAKNKAEIEFNKQMAKEGFSSDTTLKGASKELLDLKKKFDELRKPFITKNEEAIKKAMTEKTSFWSED